MALVARHAIARGIAVPLPSLPRPTARGLGIGAALAFVLLLVDALLHPRAAFDLWLMQQVQAVSLPGLPALLNVVEKLTDSSGAVAAWALVLVALVLARWWVPAMLAATLPIGGALNLLVGELLVARTRPHLPELTRSSGNWEERSFPSGHVMGAVMLYGLLFVVARRIAWAPLRLAVQGGSLAVVALVGFARVWDGAHWPTDVLGAYALGGLLLASLAALYARLEAAIGHLPLVRAAALPHDEARTHAHALTSLVLFDETTVAKVYAPGLLPTAIYWLAFQAPFPYAANRAALRAAVARRNLAGLLTRYWYGGSRVARALEVAEIDGRPALVSERIAGHAPADRELARWFLRGLRLRFEQAGLPTWQIDPRQPRAIDNVLQTADGAYTIVDLESGLVAPFASRRTWGRALRRGLVPFYDEVFSDVTRAYVGREERGLRAALGDAGFAELEATIDELEAATAEWHAGEPRLWGRLLRAALVGIAVRSWGPRLRARLTGAHEWGLAWIDRAVAVWQAEGRIDAAEAAELRRQVAAPTFQAMLPYLGAHILISIPLRFPLGSIGRPLMVLGALATAAWRRLRGQTDAAAWALARDIHSPLVVVLSAVPGAGSFAYLAAKPVRANRLLLRALADAALGKLPWHAYERSGLRRLVARPAGAMASGVVAAVPALPGASQAGVPWWDDCVPAAVGD